MGQLLLGVQLHLHLRYPTPLKKYAAPKHRNAKTLQHQNVAVIIRRGQTVRAKKSAKYFKYKQHYLIGDGIAQQKLLFNMKQRRSCS